MDIAAQIASQVDPHKTCSNPRVGCLVVQGDRMISQGTHEVFGGPHAEVNAFVSLSEAQINGSTVVVTLEPCVAQAHKKTGSCTARLIELKPAEVIIGALDPHFPGQGVQALDAAGIKVMVLNTNHHAVLNPWFEHWITTKTPFITMKVAQTLDGKITPPYSDYEQGDRAITGPETRAYVHGMRAHTQVVLTSTKTVLEDNPRLDVRHSAVLSFEPSNPDVIIVGQQEISPSAEVHKLSGRKVHQLSSLDKLIPFCQENGIASIMTECGGTLNSALLEEALIQKIELFTAPKFSGDSGKQSFMDTSSLNNFSIGSTDCLGNDFKLTLNHI